VNDSTFRLMGSENAWQRGIALTSTLRWFEADLLARERNLTGLARLNQERVAQAEAVGPSHSERVANRERQRTDPCGIINPRRGVPASSYLTGQSGQENRPVGLKCFMQVSRCGAFSAGAFASCANSNQRKDS
jgi:hypothetical protein